MSEFEEIQQTKDSLNKGISGIDKEISRLKERIHSKEREIKELQKSKEYAKRLKEIQRLEQSKTELKKEISALRSLIDFKQLASIFHSFPKKMDIVKKHRTDFKENFQKDSGESIIGLINDAGINQNEILKSLNKIENLQADIRSAVIPKDEAEDLKTDIAKINSQIKALNSKKKSEEKKCEKLEVKHNEIIEAVKGELKKLNVILEY